MINVLYEVTFAIRICRHFSSKINQTTNGPVNAHLISWHTVGTKTSYAKFDTVLKWVKVNSGSSFIELEYILLHAKFHDHRIISSVGENF